VSPTTLNPIIKIEIQIKLIVFEIFNFISFLSSQTYTPPRKPEPAAREGLLSAVQKWIFY
jgi:hypothetical protein